ncbi:MAG: hypothetical protein M3198_09335 [Actinomycetota bacterium]|nr:hypothetical protein [Actinomycetota bacterium]
MRGLLPKQPHGYYREFTVRPPAGVIDHGDRRIELDKEASSTSRQLTMSRRSSRGIRSKALRWSGVVGSSRHSEDR